MCRVETGSGAKEASITVSVLHSTHSGPSYTLGVELGAAWAEAGPRGLLTVPWEGARGLLGIAGATRQALALHCLLGEARAPQWGEGG